MNCEKLIAQDSSLPKTATIVCDGWGSDIWNFLSLHFKILIENLEITKTDTPKYTCPGSQGRLPCFFFVTKASCPDPFLGIRACCPMSLLVPRLGCHALVPFRFQGSVTAMPLSLLQYLKQAAMPLYLLVARAGCPTYLLVLRASCLSYFL